MKPYLLIITFCLFSILCGCKREVVKPQTSRTLLGKWSLVKDSSSYIIGADTAAHSTIYWGTADDYFDFRTDGKCYIREDGWLDTMYFKMRNDTSVIFTRSDAYQLSGNGLWTPVPTMPSAIGFFKNDSVKIAYSFLSNPGSFFNRIVFLEK